MPLQREVVIVEAVRSAVGRRGGALSECHSAEVLGDVLGALIERSGIEPGAIDQVVGGCVGQVGMQGFNVTRTAWLTAGLPASVAASTVDAQCGSSQQAANMAISLVASGVCDAVVGCGVELMSRVPMGSGLGSGLGKAVTRRYFEHYEWTSQFQAAELIAKKWGFSRDDVDRFGLASQERAAAAIESGRFDSQIVPLTLRRAGEPELASAVFKSDEGPRPTTLDSLRSLKPVLGSDDPYGGPDPLHTAGTSSQISDGASAVLFMTPERATALGLRPLARVVDSCLVGSDPVLMLTGPIDATQHLFARSGLRIDDIDVVEINEAFASVVLAWQAEVGADPAIVNPNGGAIALGHPLGATGSILLAKAVHQLAEAGGRYAFVTMCCGGGLGTGTILERL